MTSLWGRLISGVVDQVMPSRPDPGIPLPAASDSLPALVEIQQLRIDCADKVDRLVLICRSMWELLRPSNNLSEDDLLKKAMQVDLTDGTLDGKMAIRPKKCPSCSMLMSKRHRRCIYCGAERPLDSAFDSLSEQVGERSNPAMIPLWGLLAFDAAMQMKKQLSESVEATQTAISTAKDAQKAQHALQEFRIDYADQIDRLVLIVRSMWELLRASNNLSEDDLLKKVMEVDLRDGNLDGEIVIPPRKCPSCSRVVSKRHRRCIYCGAEVRLDSAFDSL